MLSARQMSSKTTIVPRRHFLRCVGAGLAVATAQTSSIGATAGDPPKSFPRQKVAYPIFGNLTPVFASPDRVIRETVGLRPFRESGPNLTVEKIGSKTVAHNYGHGGSGWSLSWGSSAEAVSKALESGENRYAVIGCGALGITSAILLQKAGKQVTIYTKDRHPNITSSVATGVWSPDSRICLEPYATEAFGQWWSATCRNSFKTYQSYIGLPGEPVEWVESYNVSDRPWDVVAEERKKEEGLKFGHFNDYVRDLTPASVDLAPRDNPFSEPYAKKGTRMIFNISSYIRVLIEEFASLGGRIESRAFHQASDLVNLSEKTIINASGLGSKILFSDKKMRPVRGQLCALIPQAEVRYNFSNNDAYTIARKDGIIIGASKNGIIDSTNLDFDPVQNSESILAIARSMQGLKTFGS